MGCSPILELKFRGLSVLRLRLRSLGLRIAMLSGRSHLGLLTGSPIGHARSPPVKGLL